MRNIAATRSEMTIPQTATAAVYGTAFMLEVFIHTGTPSQNR
jgi:hypothetical protein